MSKLIFKFSNFQIFTLVILFSFHCSLLTAHCSLFIANDSLHPKPYYRQADSLENNSYLYEAKLHYGFILRHHQDMAALTNIHFTAFELNLAKQTTGENLWEQLYAYPQIGLSFFYSALDNSQYLGSAYALDPYINFPLTVTHNFQLYYRFGVGLGWLSKSFSPYGDYKNIAISTNVNASIRMNFELHWNIKHFIISYGLGLSHFSNGNFEKPNLGINLITANCGVAYTLGNSGNKTFKRKDLPPLVKNSNISVIGDFGFKAIYPSGFKDFFVYNLHLSYLKKISYKSEIGGGVELFYDLSDHVMLSNMGESVANSWEIIKPAVYGAYQLDISKLAINFNLGTYLYAKYKGDGAIYDRLSIKYALSKKFFLDLSLKTYLFTADLTEYGIGYNIN